MSTTRNMPFADHRNVNLLYNARYGQFSGIILCMRQISEAADILKSLGRRLRVARLERNDTMATFGERLGVSERTVRAMEHGLGTVQIGTWIHALWILDALEPLDRVLEPRESLLDRARNARTPRRQRASRRRS